MAEDSKPDVEQSSEAEQKQERKPHQDPLPIEDDDYGLSLTMQMEPTHPERLS